jgi:DNA-binding transcriptional regulator YhcF (GntR family)/DNA-binding LacI/PurR family transcriptional regulator
MLKKMKKSSHSKYIDIRDAILRDIRSGKLPPGSKLPSREELIEEYSVARATLNKAISELINSGVLNALRKRGTFVSKADARSETALVANLSRLGIYSGTNPLFDDIGNSIFSYIVTHAPRHLKLSVLDSRELDSAGTLERYRKVIILMPLQEEIDMAKELHSTEACIVNRSVEGINCVTTNHRAATREVTELFLNKLGADNHIIYMDMTGFSQVIRNERREGFIEACENHRSFYRIISGEGFDVIDRLMEQKIQSGKKLIIVSGSRFMTGPVFKYSVLKGLTFGKDIFYSDFDNLYSEIYFGEPMMSVMQNYSELGQAAIDFLVNPGQDKNITYIPYSVIGKELYFPESK